MGFPRKFKELLEIEFRDVDRPDEAWLTYAVCATEKDSCGWGGWILEDIRKYSGEKDSSLVLPAFCEQVCPSCGKETFRTDATLKFVPSSDQTGRLVPGVDYEELPIEYDEDEV
jgi:hypothetical protein